MENQTATKLSKLHVGTNGSLNVGELKTDKQKQNAIELIRQTQTRIANLTVIVDNGKAERKAMLRRFRLTTVGTKLTEVEERTKKAKLELNDLAAQYAGMMMAFKKLGLEIDPKQVKQLKEGC